VTVARNDFAPRQGPAIKLDEDYYREAKEHFAQLERDPAATVAECAAIDELVVSGVDCPECGAFIDQPCAGSSGPHFARRERYART
jgi:hypothetical protein